jgi:hypothetical protein
MILAKKKKKVSQHPLQWFNLTLSWCLFLTKYLAMKAYWGCGCIAQRILDLALDIGEWSASLPGCFVPRERAPGTQRLGEPQSWSGCGGEEKNSQPLLRLKPLIIQPIHL